MREIWDWDCVQLNHYGFIKRHVSSPTKKELIKRKNCLHHIIWFPYGLQATQDGQHASYVNNK